MQNINSCQNNLVVPYRHPNVVIESDIIWEGEDVFGQPTDKYKYLNCKKVITTRFSRDFEHQSVIGCRDMTDDEVIRVTEKRERIIEKVGRESPDCDDNERKYYINNNNTEVTVIYPNGTKEIFNLSDK